MASVENGACSELLRKLKRGQDELQRSLQRLENDNAEKRRKQQKTRRHLAEKSINSVNDLPKKRARVELVSPGLEPKGTTKHPRRYSSTPKKCDKPLVPFLAPDVDSSLEEAILDQPTTTHLPSPKLSRVAVDTSRRLRESSLSQSFLRSSVRKKTPTPSKRGLTVSFVGKETNSRTTPLTGRPATSREKGQSLVHSLNSSRHGALERTLSQKKRKFPRRYAGDDPKLGYDWIAGLIDASDTYLNERDDEYFEDLKEFRRVNCSECSKPNGDQPSHLVSATMAISSGTEAEEEGPKLNCTTCVWSYSLNDRLFPIPRHMASNLVTEGGYGVLEGSCPVCEDKHSESKSPVRYIRVSVPKRTLQSSYRLRPHRRRSFDPNDSMGLSKHCLAGWESAKPSMVPPQPSVGLRAAAGQQPPSSNDLLNKSHTVEYNLRSRAKNK